MRRKKLSWSRVLKNSGLYGLVSFFQKAMGFLLLPIYTAYLSPDDYGIVSVVTSMVAVMYIIYTFAMEGSITRFYYEYKDDMKHVKEFWGTITIFVLINSVISTIVIFIFRNSIINSVLKDISFFPYVFLGLISLTVSPLYLIYQATLQARQLGRSYAANNAINFFLKIFLTVVFLLMTNLGAIGVLLASAITDVLFFVITLYRFLPEVSFKFNIKYFKEALKYSLPLIPHLLSGWALAMLDRIFINNMKTTYDVGIYNIGFQISNIINVITAAANQAYVPWFFEKMKEDISSRKDIINFATVAVTLYCYLAFSLSLFGRNILEFMVSAEYRIAWEIIPLLSFAYVFHGIYYFSVNTLFYNKKGTKYIPIGTFFSAILNVILNFVFVPYYGNIGASLATLISMVLSSVLIMIISLKIEKIEFNYLKMYVYSIVFFLLSMIIYVDSYFNFNVWVFFILKCILLVCITAIILYKYRTMINVILELLKSKVRRVKR